MDGLKISAIPKQETKTIHAKSFEEQLDTLKSYSFWAKYLGKR